MCENGLKLLKSNYSDSESDEEDIPPRKVARKRPLTPETIESNSNSNPNKRLPLPEVFQTKKPETTILQAENASEHQGRVRSFPHEAGNWATHVYISYKRSDPMDKVVESVIRASTLDLRLEPVQNYHISLSKTVVLKHHWINLFVERLKAGVDNSLKQYTVSFENLSIYCNEERTRTFLGLDISSGSDKLLEATRIVDDCLREFSLETFYKDPSFHLSIAWCLGDQEADLETQLPDLQNVIDNLIDRTSCERLMRVDKYHCRIGNKIFEFHLQP